jgi:hypothetical protein
MPEAIKTHTTCRRDARIAATIAAACGLSSGSDDRALIEKCEQFQTDLDAYLLDCKVVDNQILQLPIWRRSTLG